LVAGHYGAEFGGFDGFGDDDVWFVSAYFSLPFLRFSLHMTRFGEGKERRMR
jgi:hypothetical protein